MTDPESALVIIDQPGSNSLQKSDETVVIIDSYGDQALHQGRPTNRQLYVVRTASEVADTALIIAGESAKIATRIVAIPVVGTAKFLGIVLDGISSIPTKRTNFPISKPGSPQTPEVPQENGQIRRRISSENSLSRKGSDSTTNTSTNYQHTEDNRQDNRQDNRVDNRDNQNIKRGPTFFDRSKTTKINADKVVIDKRTGLPLWAGVALIGLIIVGGSTFLSSIQNGSIEINLTGKDKTEPNSGSKNDTLPDSINSKSDSKRVNTTENTEKNNSQPAGETGTIFVKDNNENLKKPSVSQAKDSSIILKFTEGKQPEVDLNDYPLIKDPHKSLILSKYGEFGPDKFNRIITLVEDGQIGLTFYKLAKDSNGILFLLQVKFVPDTENGGNKVITSRVE